MGKQTEELFLKGQRNVWRRQCQHQAEKYKEGISSYWRVLLLVGKGNGKEGFIPWSLLIFLGEKESFYFVVLSLIGCLTGKKKKHTSLIVVMEETLSH